MTLTQYLQESLAKPYRVGEWDCALFIAGWVDHLAGVNRLSHFRGNYRKKDEGLRKFGPLRRRVSHELELLGFVHHETPREGDVAIIRGDMVGLVSKVGDALAVTTILENTLQGGFITLPNEYAKGFYRWEK
jgi:hypothetical protein